MRPRADAQHILIFARELGRLAGLPATMYLTWGATAVLGGWRATSVGIDVRFEPDADELLRLLPSLKERLQVNIELASPPDFIPELPGWRERSPFVAREGLLDVRHFDPYSQALSKLERAFDQDLQDVEDMLQRGLVQPAQLLELYKSIEPDLFRYPAIDPPSFRGRVESALGHR